MKVTIPKGSKFTIKIVTMRRFQNFSHLRIHLCENQYLHLFYVRGWALEVQIAEYCHMFHLFMSESIYTEKNQQRALHFAYACALTNSK